jgi:hypothetical protein
MIKIIIFRSVKSQVLGFTTTRLHTLRQMEKIATNYCNGEINSMH